MNTDRIYNSSPAAIGIDLGGTKTKAVSLNPDGTVLWRQCIPTPRVDGYNAIIFSVSKMILEAVDKLPAGNPFTVGVGIPGSIDSSTNIVRNANSTCLIGHPLQSDIERLIGHPVSIRNYADCFIRKFFPRTIVDPIFQTIV